MANTVHMIDWHSSGYMIELEAIIQDSNCILGFQSWLAQYIYLQLKLM